MLVMLFQTEAKDYYVRTGHIFLCRVSRKIETKLEQDDDVKAIDGLAGILKDNIQFCKSTREADEAYNQLKDFTKEVITIYGRWESKLSRETLGKAFGESAMLNFLSFVLLPLSYGIFFDFMAGNLVASFMQARTLLEQLAKCYLADVEICERQSSFFHKRLQHIGDSRGIGKMIETLGPDAKQLWNELSNNWVHMKGLKKLVTAVSYRGIPSYAVIVPITYGSEDIPDIVELTRSVKDLRELLRETFEKWKEKSQFGAYVRD
jgi:hypothetical protein